MKRYILFLTACLAIPAIMSAQSIFKAQKQMDKYDYSGAIETLKLAASDEKTRNEALPMLAECYRMQCDVINMKETYAQVITLPDVKPESYYYYAQALQSIGEYEKAREMFQEYVEKNPSDPRGSLFVAHCDSVLGPWKAKVPDFELKLANNINTAQSEFGPAFYGDVLTFASDFSNNPGEGKEYGWTGRGYLNIMKARPLSTGNFWGSMGASSEFDSKFDQVYHDGPAAFSSDGNNIYFTRSFFGKAKRKGTVKTNLLKIFFAYKVDGVWGDVKPFFLNSTEYSVGHPTLSADGQTIYFVSDMPGGEGGTDIWMCKRESDAWSQPINLGSKVNTTQNEMFPTMRDDGVLYFASDGHPGYGALDIFKTKYVNEAWTTPVNLYPPINGSYDDFAIAFAAGFKNGFFSSNRPDGFGSDDIYAFRIKEPPPALPAYISGFVKDKISLIPIAGATVFLFNPTTGKVKVFKTDANGKYEAIIDNKADYIVKATMLNYIADCTPFAIAEIIPGTTVNLHDLLIDKLVINKTFRIDNIYYDFDKYNIREDAKPELDKLVRIMKENPINVELGSFTDSRGSFAYNDKLSQQRAESVVKYIISTGIDQSRITAKGYGERQLTNKCSDGVKCTPEEHQANRRTEFKVTSFISPSTNTDQFDPGKYKVGEELELRLLPDGFLRQCK
jgi:outer membrane protein OmpA-like peptidoglycan-associated protein